MSITLCNLFVLNHIFLHTRSVLISINLFSSNRKIWISSANFKKPTTLSIVLQPLKGVSFVLFVFVLNDLKNVHVSLSLSMLYVTFLLHTVTSLFIKSIYRSVSSWRYGQQSVVFIHWGTYNWYNFFYLSAIDLSTTVASAVLAFFLLLRVSYIRLRLYHHWHVYYRHRFVRSGMDYLLYRLCNY